jgi:hypothetical protein
VINLNEKQASLVLATPSIAGVIADHLVPLLPSLFNTDVGSTSCCVPANVASSKTERANHMSNNGFPLTVDAPPNEKDGTGIAGSTVCLPDHPLNGRRYMSREDAGNLPVLFKS